MRFSLVNCERRRSSARQCLHQLLQPPPHYVVELPTHVALSCTVCLAPVALYDGLDLELLNLMCHCYKCFVELHAIDCKANVYLVHTFCYVEGLFTPPQANSLVGFTTAPKTNPCGYLNVFHFMVCCSLFLNVRKGPSICGKFFIFTNGRPSSLETFTFKPQNDVAYVLLMN